MIETMNSIPRETPQAGPSALSIATFVLGLLGFFTYGLTAIVAIITGIIEIANIRAGRSSRAGYQLNMVGFVLALLTIVVFIVIGLFAIHLFKPMLDDVQNLTSGTLR
jgi:uncharacterized membrane protein